MSGAVPRSSPRAPSSSRCDVGPAARDGEDEDLPSGSKEDQRHLAPCFGPWMARGSSSRSGLRAFRRPMATGQCGAAALARGRLGLARRTEVPPDTRAAGPDRMTLIAGSGGRLQRPVTASSAVCGAGVVSSPSSLPGLRSPLTTVLRAGPLRLNDGLAATHEIDRIRPPRRGDPVDRQHAFEPKPSAARARLERRTERGRHDELPVLGAVGP